MPPCSWATHRATASPSPVPPPAVGAEALEDALAVLGRDSPAVVGDLEPPVGRRRRRRRRAPAVPAGACRARVVEDVDEQLAQPGRVGLDDQVGGHRRPRTAPVRPAAATWPTDSSTSERSATGSRSSSHDPRLQPGELEQVVDQPAQPLGLLERGAEVLGVGGHDAVGEVLEQRGHRRERRTQLVGDGRDQVAALAVDGGEVLGHPVEGGGELADLVGGASCARGRSSRRAPSPATTSVIRRSGATIPAASSWVTPRASATLTGSTSRGETSAAEPSRREQHGGDHDGGDDEQAELDLDARHGVERRGPGVLMRRPRARSRRRAPCGSGRRRPCCAAP